MAAVLASVVHETLAYGLTCLAGGGRIILLPPM